MIEAQQELAVLLGDQLSTEWRAAFDATPRHLFLPDRAWRSDGTSLETIDRRADPDAWCAAAYSDAVIVTQLDDQRRPTSSCSMPSVVFGMLDQLDVHEGQRILEIGTGTGWNAALLAQRIGDENLVSVEIDSCVADGARSNLRKVGHRPSVVTGDGQHGWPQDGGPVYDRVEATCSVHSIPHAWLAQSRPGGVVVTPWETKLYGGLLLRLEVVGPDGAQGRFVDTASFMPLRGQQTRPIIDEPDDFDDIADITATDLDPAEALDDGDDSRLAVSLQVPDCRLTWDTDEHGGLRKVWLLAHDAWAAIDNDGTVRQAGTRLLWNEVCAAYSWWVRAGRPTRDRFGMTVEPGRQWLWLDESAQVVSTRS